MALRTDDPRSQDMDRDQRRSEFRESIADKAVSKSLPLGGLILVIPFSLELRPIRETIETVAEDRIRL
jgi:hypothetical protein